MNIYCLIFMCTFGANNTDTETARSSNSLVASDNVKGGADVASLILPGKGEPVPDFGDIAMELPKPINNSKSTVAIHHQKTPNSPSEDDKIMRPLSLTDILLPPKPPRGQQISN